jgi:hypothetical protein
MHLLFLRTGNSYNLLAELVRDVPQSGSHLSGAFCRRRAYLAGREASHGALSL